MQSCPPSPAHVILTKSFAAGVRRAGDGDFDLRADFRADFRGGIAGWTARGLPLALALAVALAGRAALGACVSLALNRHGIGVQPLRCTREHSATVQCALLRDWLTA